MHRGDPPRVAVVGGSLGGLMAALMLRDVGCDVQVFERSRARLQGRGAGIVLHPVTTRYFESNRLLDLDRVSASTRTLRYLTRSGDVITEVPVNYRFTSYATLYGALVAHLESERYRLGSECVDLTQEESSVGLRFADGRAGAYELVVAADGVGSTVRRLLFPEARPEYAGYVGWRGTLPERHLPPETGERLAGTIVYFVARGTHILSYPIPAAGPAERLVNWVWYRNVSEAALTDLTTDARGVRHDTSVPPGSVRAEHLDAVRRAADEELPPLLADLVKGSPQPFVQVVVDLATPRMALGRVALIGDAAFALRPHIAVGTAKAADDARTLAEAIAAAGGDVPAALRTWEPARLALGRATLARARALGESVQLRGSYRPGDQEVLFGLHQPGDSSYP